MRKVGVVKNRDVRSEPRASFFRKLGDSWCFFLVAALALTTLACSAPGTKYAALRDAVERTRFIDVHAHPSLAHIDYPAGDRYPTLEPPISRPYWVAPEGRVAVFDALQVRGLRTVYGYTRPAVTEADLPELKKLSEEFWQEGRRAGLNKVLDRCGIERVFYNAGSRKDDLDPERTAWVPFIDSYLSPFPAPNMKGVSPEFREWLASSASEAAERAKAAGRPFDDLPSYLAFVDAALTTLSEEGAVALKLGVAYTRTLWFDDPDEAEVRSLFAAGLEGRTTDWPSYKKVQDFVARHIFLKAGELGLPVHVHTGFGADAGLRNLDSSALNLESVLSDIRFKETRFLILHASYPFADKLKPLLEKRNVFVDFSAVNWMVVEEELGRILEDWFLYPGATEKVMFGSDAGAPVLFWVAARNSRDALYRALAALVDRGRLTEDGAVRVAEKVMRTNALRLHEFGGR
ncbi:MAG: amidohydrolase family protein [Candidatus Aminicenantes bacterium]|nr:amidohydrolase family protein [Candidatus Aminicenantes bacterium]